MKFKFLGFIVMLLVAMLITVNAQAREVVLEWSEYTGSTNVIGFNLYMHQDANSSYNYDVPLVFVSGRDKTTVTVDVPINDGRVTGYFFVLRAITSESIESPNSNEAYLELDLTTPAAPQGLMAKWWEKIVSFFLKLFKSNSVSTKWVS